MAKEGNAQGNPQGIIATTQHAVSDVARTGVEGAKAVAGSAVGAAADVATSVALAATGQVLKVVRGARKMVAAPKKRRKAARSTARRSPKRRTARRTKTSVKRKATIARKKMRAMPRRKRK